MWLWILLSLITISNITRASPETIDSEFVPEENEDDFYLYSNERPYDESPRESRDIEARRRSALDKNFMRFGRSYPSAFSQKNYEDEFSDSDDETYSRMNLKRNHNKNDNFIRFGRGGDFLRFGREAYSRKTRGPDKNFIRFGRSVSLKRNRRSVEPNENMDDFNKRGTNRDMLRFGRANNRDMLRFGRANNRDMLRFGRRDNFLRFGRNFISNSNIDGFNQMTTNQNQSLANERLNNEKFTPLYNSLLDLLTEFALQNLRHNNNNEEDKDMQQRVR